MIPPYDEADALDYDPEHHTLVVTNRVSRSEFGASQVVARDVPTWFGLWAAATWKAALIPASGVGEVFRSLVPPSPQPRSRRS